MAPGAGTSLNGASSKDLLHARTALSESFEHRQKLLWLMKTDTMISTKIKKMRGVHFERKAAEIIFSRIEQRRSKAGNRARLSG